VMLLDGPVDYSGRRNLEEDFLSYSLRRVRREVAGTMYIHIKANPAGE